MAQALAGGLSPPRTVVQRLLMLPCSLQRRVAAVEPGVQECCRLRLQPYIYTALPLLDQEAEYVQRSCMQKCGLESTWLESSSAEKDLGVLTEKLKINQQLDSVVVKAEHILGCINRIISSKSGGVIIPLYSAIARLYLEFCVHFRAAQCREDVDKLEQVQPMVTKMIKARRLTDLMVLYPTQYRPGMMREETGRASRSIPGSKPGVTGRILGFLIMGQST
ncbi:hypothetical protein QYF61_027089 [Mycteria americana]|uniref:Uncharacterized protein n=1 Tax=Mycteria americana TaxID=33587 RepID=A0AAN7NCC5_MYCAM|nr:hypothetical protein QYF61_027089 [Mycteria americana]